MAFGAEKFVGLVSGGFHGVGGPASVADTVGEVLGADLAVAVGCFAATVVAGGAWWRSERRDAVPFEQLGEVMVLEGGAVVAFDDQWRAMGGEERLDHGDGGVGRLVGHGLPGQLHAGGEVTDAEDQGIDSIDRLGRARMVHGPDGARLVPGKPQHGDAMGGAIGLPPEMLKFQQFAARHGGEGGPEGRRAHVTTFAVEPFEGIAALRRGGLLAGPASRQA